MSRMKSEGAETILLRQRAKVSGARGVWPRPRERRYASAWPSGSNLDTTPAAESFGSLAGTDVESDKFAKT